MELSSAALKPPVGLPKSQTRVLSQHADGGVEPTGAGQISSYLNDMLAENQEHLSGDFRQSLKLLMNKDKGRAKRRVEGRELGVSGDLGSVSTGGAVTQDHSQMQG